MVLKDELKSMTKEQLVELIIYLSSKVSEKEKKIKLFENDSILQIEDSKNNK